MEPMNPHAKPATKRIFLLDDEPIVRMSFVRMLGRVRRDWWLVDFGDPEAAIEHALRDPPDLFVTDICHQNDQPDGVDVIKTLRGHRNCARLPILVVTGAAHINRYPEKALAAGADAILLKPVQISELLRAISELTSTAGFALPDLVQLAQERPELDYKEVLDLSSRDGCASLAKDVIAFANYGGGWIVVGMREFEPGKFDACGVGLSPAEMLETTRLHKAIAPYMDPLVQ